MVHTTAHRPYIQHKAYQTFHSRRFHLNGRKFAEGVFLGAWLFLLGVLLYTHYTTQLIDPTRVLLKHEQITKPIQILGMPTVSNGTSRVQMDRSPLLDTRTHILSVKVETSKDLTALSKRSDDHLQGSVGKGSRPTPTIKYPDDHITVGRPRVSEDSNAPVANKTPVQKPQASPQTVSTEEIKAQIEREFGAAATVAKRVAFAESSFNPRATHRNTNGSVDKGVFQISTPTHNISDSCAFDSQCNIHFAHELFLKQGWGPWYSSKHLWGS